MSSEDLPWFCKGTMWLRTAEKLHVNLCKSPHSHVHWNDSKACCKSEYFLQLLCCRYDEVTSSNPLPMSTGRRLKMVFCVAVEPRADGNADLSLQSQDSTSLVRRVPSSFSPCPCQHFTMAKGDGIVPSTRSCGCCSSLLSHSLQHGCVRGGRGGVEFSNL